VPQGLRRPAGVSYDAFVILIRIFRICAITEAVTWLALLASMYEKYIADTRSETIHFTGSLHGYAFCAYVIVVFLVRAEYRWSNRMTLLALAASVPPLATLPFERWAYRRLMRERAQMSAPPQAL
jgi:integral membrane protein